MIATAEQRTDGAATVGGGRLPLNRGARGVWLGSVAAALARRVLGLLCLCLTLCLAAEPSAAQTAAPVPVITGVTQTIEQLGPTSARRIITLTGRNFTGVTSVLNRGLESAGFVPIDYLDNGNGILIVQDDSTIVYTRYHTTITGLLFGGDDAQRIFFFKVSTPEATSDEFRWLSSANGPGSVIFPPLVITQHWRNIVSGYTPAFPFQNQDGYAFIEAIHTAPTKGNVFLNQVPNPDTADVYNYTFTYKPVPQNIKTAFSDTFILSVNSPPFQQYERVYVFVTNTAPVLKSFAARNITNAPTAQGLNIDDLAVDPDGDPLTFAATPTATPAGCGTVARVSDTSMTFTPATGFVGACNVAFSATDGVTGVSRTPVGAAMTLQPAAGTVVFNVTADPAAPTVTAIAPATGPTLGGTVVTITGTNFTAASTVKFGATSATAVTFTSATSLTATAPAGAVGSVDVTVTTASGASAASAADQFAYAKASQTIAFTSAVPASPVVGGTYTVAATGGGSGLPVTFSIDAASAAGACTISGATVSFTGAGACLVDANQAGNTDYAAAAQMQQSITVGKAAQVVAFTSTVPASPVVGGTYTVTATGGASGNPVTFTIDAASAAGACTISGATVSFTGAGACLIDANQAGNANYNAAPQVQQTITIGKAAQVVAFTSTIPANPVVGGTYAVTASGGASGLPVTVTIDAASAAGACTISGATVSFTGVGACIVDANQAGNANYNAATQQQQTLTIGKAAQTVAFTSSVPASSVVGGSYTVTATGGASGLPVTFTIDAASAAGACTISGATVSFTGVGACLIDANQAGNANYLAAAQQQQTLTIGKAAQTIAFTSAVPASPVVGGSYAVTATGGASGLPLTFSIDAASAAGACTISGSTVSFTGAGACIIDANQAGNANYLAAAQQQQSITVGKAPQTIAFTSTVPANPVVGGSTTVSATGGASGLPVTFSIDAASATGACSLSGSTVSFTGAGACIIDANQAGNANYLAAAQQQQTLTVGKASQSIAFTSTVPSPALVGATYTVAATGGASGNPVTFTVDAASTTGACSVAGAVVSFTGAGSCVIDANQAGTANYSAASQIQQTVAIAKAAQSVTFTKPADVTFGAGPVSLSATATSGLTVAFASTTSAVCTISGTTATVVGAGTCSITASQAGNAAFLAAPDAAQSFNVAKAAQTVAFTSAVPASPKVGGSYTVAATGGASGLPVTFSIDATSTVGACTVSSAVVSFTGAGLCIINANQSGNGNYLPAAQMQQTAIVIKATQSITFTKPADQTFGAGPVALSATATSGLTVAFASTTSAVCTVTGASATIVGAGTCSITAAQAGNVAYLAAPDVVQSFAVGKAAQTIAFTSAVPASPKVGGTYAVTATGGASGNPVVFSIDAASTAGACALSGSTVSFTGAGSCLIDANQAGNANYLAAAQVQQTAVITKATQTISFAKPADQTFGAGPVALAATATSGLAVSFASTTPAVCTVAGATATLVGAGACSITASQAGNAGYLAAADVVQAFSVGKASQTIAFIKPADILYAPGAVVALSATATSGLAVGFASLTTGVCTVAGATATIVSTGACSIKASQAGNANFNAAPDVTQSFNALGEPKIAATATVSPTSFSRPGTTLVFTFTLTNTGNIAATGVSLRDARLGPISCAATTIATGGSVTCTGSTVSTASDLAARGLSVSPQLTYSYGAPAAVAAASQAAARGSLAASPAQAAAATTITVTVSLNVSVTANVDVAAVQAATKSAIQGLLSQRGNLLTTTGPDTARAHSRLGGGTLFGDTDNDNDDPGSVTGFAASRGGLGSGLDRTRLGGIGSMLGYDAPRGGSFGGDGAGLGSGSTAGGFGGLSGGGFGNSSGAGFGGMESSVSSRFGRASPSPLAVFGTPQDGTYGPYGAPWGVPRDAAGHGGQDSRSGPSAFRFTGQSDNGIGRFAFATSLSQMRESVEAADRAKLASASRFATQALGDRPAGAAAPNAPVPNALGLSAAPPIAKSAARPGSVDVWVEGTSSYFVNDRIDGRRQGHAAVVHSGIDTIVMPGLLIGVMGSYDWMADSSTTLGQNRDGRGWMAGPYLSARLTKNLFFDARASWGQATNRVDPIGAYVDTFATSRALASAKLTGDWTAGDWRFRPSAEVIYFSETAKAYTNAIGIDIASQAFSLGRTLFGPEVGYRMTFADKSVLEPFLGLKGIWDFARTSETTAAGTPVGGGDLRARLEAGVSYRAPSGVSIRATGAYDGIGSTGGTHAVQGQARLVVPLR